MSDTNRDVSDYFHVFPSGMLSLPSALRDEFIGYCSNPVSVAGEIEYGENYKTRGGTLYQSVEDYTFPPCLNKLKPYFNPTFSLFICVAGHPWPIHVDHGRSTALNIPLKNCTDQCITTFYSDPDPSRNCVIDLETPQKGYHISVFEGELTPVHQFSMTSPTLVSNLRPHSVVNNSNEPRLCFSWGSQLGISSLIETLESTSHDF